MEELADAKMGGVDNPAFKTDDTYGGHVASSESTDGHANNDEGKKERELTVEENVIRKNILKNVLVICTAFVLQFIAYGSTANLQSSINENLGTLSLAALYISMIVSCCFLPSWMIRKFGEKTTMAFCMLNYLPYCLAQFYPSNATLVPTAALLGVFAAPLWAAKCTYLTHIASKYAELTGQARETVITKFFGIFFLFFQMNNVFGNIIAVAVLSKSPVNISIVNDRLEFCGADYCSDVDLGDASLSSEVSELQRYIMFSAYGLCIIVAAGLIFLFVEPLSVYVSRNEGESRTKSSLKEFVATMNHCRHPYQPLILMLTIYSGLEQGYFTSDFTAGYISCGLGVHMVGYLLICYGMVDAVFSGVFSPVVKITGRVPVFTLGAALNFAMIVFMLKWKPSPDESGYLYMVSILWAVSDAIWQTQINAFYGIIFPDASEAAFSNYRLWESVGFFVSYACSSVICVEAKIYMLIGFLAPGIIGYYSIEIIQRYGGLRKGGDGHILTIDQRFCPRKDQTTKEK